MADFDTVNLIKGFEGWNPKAYWDHKGYSIGYGRFGAKPGDTTTKEQEDAWLTGKVGEIDQSIGKAFPNLQMQPHQRRALTSFTYNLGPGWMSDNSRLRAAVQAGDWQTAANVMNEYNKASGKVEPGLVKRRAAESAMLLGGPMPEQPTLSSALTRTSMPQDPVTGAWTPEEVIKSQYGLAQQFRNTPDASTPLGALAKGLGGFFGGVYQGSADNTVRANQALRSQAVQGMAGETDSGALGRRLLGTGIPGLQEQGMALIAHSAQKKADLQAQGEMQRQNFEFQRKLAMDLKRQEEEMKMARFNAMLGNGPGVPQVPPAATSAMPSAPMSAPSSSVPSGVPGISMGAAPVPQAGQMPMASPMSGTDMPARAESPFDKRRLGMAVAAGVISPEAAKLLMESNKFDEAYDKEAGKDFAAAYKGYRDTLSKSSKMLGSYNTLEALIKNPATIQGMAAGARKTFDRTMELMGIKTEGLAPTQIMEALSNELTLQMRDAAGGMPGAMSDKDLGFLQAMMANTANSPEANLFLVQMRKRVLEREQMVAKLALKYAQNNGGRIDHKFDVLLQEWAEKNPLWSDKEMGTLSGQVEAVTKTPTAQAGTQGQQAATAAPSVDQVSSSPVGTVVNGMRKIGPNQWVREGSGASALQSAQPTAPATQAQRVQAKREEAARAEAKKAAQAKQENDAFKAAFDADLQTMDPVDLARKYDNYRWQLGSARAMALDDALKARVR